LLFGKNEPLLITCREEKRREKKRREEKGKKEKGNMI
jgi:hypothetical protein